MSRLAKPHFLGRGLAAAALLLSVCGAAQAGIDPQEFAVSPDITITYFGEPLTDEGASQSLSPDKRLDFGALPQGVDVTGFHVEGEQIYFAVDQPVLLGGQVFTPRDVILTDGSDYELFYKGENEGIPRSVKIDAVALIEGELFLSYDTTFRLDDLIADEDLVWASDGHTIFFDGSAAGVPMSVDLDAAHFIDESTLALSFDTTAKLGEFVADDEDVLAFENDFLAVVYDGSSVESSWPSADLDGVSIGAPEPPPPVDLIFEDGFEAGNTSAWSASVP